MNSIYDVAELAGVSATTVSRVLNSKSCSKETSAKVLSAIDELGYVQDARASTLKCGVNRCIGLVVPDIANPVYPVAVKAIHTCARERGYHLILGNTYGSVDEEMEFLQLMARERVAGVIIATSEGDDDTCCNSYIASLIERGTKVVLAGRARDGLAADLVGVDNEHGAYKAVNYLLRTGHRKIAIVSGQPNHLSTQGRFIGYLRALEEYALEPKERFKSFFGLNVECGRSQMREILHGGDIPDAVFCGNDLLAVGAMEAIKDHGLRIPTDIAVVGFDDIDLASMVSPKLTTVVQPQERLATMACELLLNRIENVLVGEPVELVMKPEFVVRESA